MPVITHTLRPSVTGEGDDMFCFCIRALPPPRRCFQQRGAARPIHAPETTGSPPSATLRKM